MAGTLRITLVKSPHKRRPRQRRTIEALGLHKILQTVEKEDIPSIRGMIRSIEHLVEVEEIT
jgi:large subunit ribosomal protein L30